MIDSFTFEGSWWIPENSMEKVPGIFSFSQEEGGYLNLDGGFLKITPENLNILDNKGDRQELILGESSNGEKITLWQCTSFSHSLTYMFSNQIQYRANIIFRNTHFNNSKEIRFHKLRIRYQHLSKWMLMGSNLLKLFSEDTSKKEEYINININSDYLILLNIYKNLPAVDKNNITELDLFDLYVELIVKNGNKAVHFNQIWEFQQIINSFFNFLLNQRINILRLTGYLDKSSDTTEIIYQQIEKPKVDSNLSNIKILIPSKLFLQFPEKYINKWISLFEKNRTVLALYNILFLNEKLFIEERFLAIIQAIEAYHSRNYGLYEISQVDFSKKINAILESISDNELREWTKQKLIHQNQKALSQRLSELFSPFEELFKYNITNIKAFVHRSVALRNDISHGKDLDKFLKDKERFYYSIVLLKVLLECHLLEEIGFSFEEITPQVTNSLSNLKNRFGQF